MTRHPYRRLLARALLGRRRTLALLLAWSTVEAVPALVSGWLIATAVDDGFLAGWTAVGFAWLALLAGAAIVGATGTRQTYLRLADLVEPFRDELVDVVVSGALHGCTEAGRPPDTAAVDRLTHQVEIVRESFAGVIMVVQAFVVTTAAALVGLLTLAPRAAALVVPPVAVGLGLFLATLPALAARQRAMIVADEGVAAAVAALADGLRDVVACGAEDGVRASTCRAVDAQEGAAIRLARVTSLRAAALGVSTWVPLFLLLAGSSWLVSHGATPGTVLGSITYVSMSLQPAMQGLIRVVGGSGLWLIVALSRIVEGAGWPAGEGAVPAPSPAVEGAVPPPRPSLGQLDSAPLPHPDLPPLELRGVTFGYGRHAEPVVRDLDLLVPDGDHLAVVGPSGAGKSTLAGIVAGLLRPQGGLVLLGGAEAGTLGRPDFARHCLLIPQQAYVFAGTVEENLAYLRDDAAPAEIDEAVDAVGGRELVARLGGLRAHLHPGQLSAGERQLITLARAYLHPSRLTILDEATCHLDPAADARVERAFSRRPGALIVVAHRMSSALRARRVLVLDGDRAVVGTHGELLDRSVLYRDLAGHWHPAGAPPLPAPTD